MDVASELAPALDRAGPAVLLDGADAAVEGDPRHHLRVREVLARPANLPDALVGLLPGVLEVQQEAALERP